MVDFLRGVLVFDQQVPMSAQMGRVGEAAFEKDFFFSFFLLLPATVLLTQCLCNSPVYFGKDSSCIMVQCTGSTIYAKIIRCLNAGITVFN